MHASFIKSLKKRDFRRFERHSLTQVCKTLPSTTTNRTSVLSFGVSSTEAFTSGMYESDGVIDDLSQQCLQGWKMREVREMELLTVSCSSDFWYVGGNGCCWLLFWRLCAESTFGLSYLAGNFAFIMHQPLQGWETDLEKQKRNF